MKNSSKKSLVLKLKELSPKDMLKLDDSIHQGKIEGILIKGVMVSFSQVLCIHLKNQLDKNPLVEGFYPLLLIENHIEDLLRLVFSDGFLPSEIFAMGSGIYQFEDEYEYLLAYPEFPNRKVFDIEFLNDLDFKSKKGFMRIQFQDLQNCLRNVKPSLNSRKYFDNQYPIFNFKAFENYLYNWLRGNDFVIEEGKFIVRPTNFDQVA